MRRASASVRWAGLVLAVTAVLLASLAGPATAQTGSVLVVGDSLEVGTGPYLRRELASTPVTIDAKESRPSSVGVGVLSSLLRPGHRVVVFDLGVNDGPSAAGPLARNLATVRDMVGDRCLVVATLSRPAVNGVSIENLNRVVESFVTDTPGAQLFDWHAATAGDPSLLAPDGVHAAAAGYATRARLLAGTIEGCFDAGSGEEDPAPRRERPASGPAPRARAAVREDPAWLELARRLSRSPVVAAWQAGLHRLDAAGHDLVGALSPPRPEPKLGEAPG